MSELYDALLFFSVCMTSPDEIARVLIVEADWHGCAHFFDNIACAAIAVMAATISDGDDHVAAADILRLFRHFLTRVLERLPPAPQDSIDAQLLYAISDEPRQHVCMLRAQQNLSNGALPSCWPNLMVMKRFIIALDRHESVV